MFRMAAAAPLAAGLMMLGGPAWADCVEGPDGGTERLCLVNPDSGNCSYFESEWYISTRYLRLEMETAGVPDGRCNDSLFDWAVENGHYDWRIVRNCDSVSFRGANGHAGYNEPDVATFTGMQKQAPCYYRISDHQSTLCVWSDSRTECQSPPNDGYFGNPAIRMWKRFRDGTNDYRSGGDPTSPSE